MRVPRIHVDAPLRPEAPVELRGSAARHIRKVLRLRPGAELILFDGRGGEFDAHVTGFGAGSAQVAVRAPRAAAPEPALSIELWPALPRGGRMDFLIEKATELGVQRICPVVTERVVVRLNGERAERRRAHWQSVAIGACEQCGRARVPDIALPRPLGEMLEQPPAGQALVLDPAAPCRVRELTSDGEPITLLVGPEGGFEQTELERIYARSFDGVTLGPRILRTDTAALAALAALQSHFGDT